MLVIRLYSLHTASTLCQSLASVARSIFPPLKCPHSTLKWPDSNSPTLTRCRLCLPPLLECVTIATLHFGWVLKLRALPHIVAFCAEHNPHIHVSITRSTSYHCRVLHLHHSSPLNTLWWWVSPPFQLFSLSLLSYCSSIKVPRDWHDHTV